MARFDGKTAVVTGGTSGIGFAVAKHFVEEGAKVFIAGRDADRGESAAEELGEAVTFVRTDVADDHQVEALAKKAAGKDGRIHIWVNNAGIEGGIGPMEVFDDQMVRSVLDVNIKGVFSGMRHASGYMQKGDVIMNTASFVGTRVPVSVGIAYGASKAAVVSMTRSAAEGFKERGVRVYGIAPWIVDTPMIDRLTGGQGPEARAEFAAMFAPSGKLASPAEIAQVVADACEGNGSQESGQVVLVDAGPVIEPL